MSTGERLRHLQRRHHAEALEGKRQRERRAVPQRADDTDVAVHRAGQPLGNRKTQSGSRRGGSPGGGGTLELHENSLAFILAETWAGIAYDELKLTAAILCFLGTQPYRHAAGLGELDRVANQVEQNLAQAGFIAKNLARHVGGERPGDLQPLVERLRREQFDDVLDAGSNVDGLAAKLDAAGLDLREVQDLVDQPEKRRRGLLDRGGIGALLGRKRRLAYQARHSEDAVHRRPDLVTH